MLIGSMFGFLGNTSPRQAARLFYERLADSYNKFESVDKSGLTYSSVNMFDRAVASSRFIVGGWGGNYPVFVS